MNILNFQSFFSKNKYKSFKRPESNLSNLAIISTYCGETSKKTFKPIHYRKYPSYFFSNNNEILSKANQFGWNSIKLDQFEKTEDRLISSQQAKYVKVVPHLIPELAEYDYLLYLDDKVNVDENRIETFISDLKNKESILSIRFHDFLPNNVLFEFAEGQKQKRNEMQRDQIVKYLMSKLEQGYKFDSQLYWTSAILRDMRHPKIRDLNNRWYEDIQQCGIHCQISFLFIAQEFGNIGVLPEFII